MNQKIKCINGTETSEKFEKDVAMLERFTPVSDESGHRYIIPLYLKTEFDTWEAMDTESEEFDPGKYEQYRIEGGLLTFTDPKVN